MSELRIIPVVFGGKHFIITDHRMQYDYGQVLDFKDLELPDSFEARFSNAPTGESVGQIGSNNRIRIPKQFFESGEPIYCYITLHDEETDGRTVYTVKTPISPSSDRTDAEPEPEEESIITQAITALNTAVEKTAQDVVSADALVQAASEQADRAEQAAEGVEGYAERAESAQQAAESARDRATQAETSARTSAATASEKASEAISSATTASQSALTAEGASESAQESADASAQSALRASQFAVDASVRAHNASEYAQTASGYASNANTSAQTASQKASEAAQSAQAATQAKTDAETAKTASQTAQTASESARDGAITAKEDAESARDEAQDIVDGITGKVEQIDSNTERIKSLEDDRYKPYPTDTASGSIASFPDGADGIPLKSCIVQVEPVQEGSGDPSPDNVRPISGWTGCEVQRTGKNLLDQSAYDFQAKAKNGLTYTVQSDGTIHVTGTATAIGGPGLINILNLPNGTYTYLDERSQAVHCAYRGLPVSGGPSFSLPNPFTVDDTFMVFVNLFCKATGTYDLTVHPQIELGSTATSYEPYTGRAYPIAFPTEAGTIYGGYVDVTGGELVVDRAQIASYNGETLPSTWISDRDVYTSGTTPTIGAQVVYKLVEPIHYTLTPTEIKTLLGQNNIWADCGDAEVEYRADTTLYINRLTEPDADMIADSNITSGQYFMVGNSLFKATANIASGAQVIVGTNCIRKSLSEALNEINA